MGWSSPSNRPFRRSLLSALSLPFTKTRSFDGLFRAIHVVLVFLLSRSRTRLWRIPTQHSYATHSCCVRPSRRSRLSLRASRPDWEALKNSPLSGSFSSTGRGLQLWPNIRTCPLVETGILFLPGGARARGACFAGARVSACLSEVCLRNGWTTSC